MTPSEFVEVFSDNLYFVEYKHKVYLLDASNLGDPNYDYGVVDVYDKSEFPIYCDVCESIPGFYVDSFVDFMSDDLHDTYGMSPDAVAKVVSKNIEYWRLFLPDGLPDWIYDVSWLFNSSTYFDYEPIRIADDDEIETILDYRESLHNEGE